MIRPSSTMTTGYRAVCPWCNWSIESCWEWDDDSGAVQCQFCEKWFRWERHTEVTYNADRMDGEQEVKPDE